MHNIHNYIYTHTHSKSKCMNKVKKIEVITEHHNKEHMTMQDVSSTVSFSPSFSFYTSGDSNLIEAAVKAVRESQSYYSGDEDKDFEFETSPLREESFFHFPTTTTGEDDVAVTSKNLFYGGWNLSSPSESNSSSESDDLEDLSPRRFYCFWSPIKSPARGDSTKSKSLSAPKRCRIKEFLRRSHSDGAVSSSKRCSFKDLLRRSHSHGGDVSPSGNGSPVVKGKSKTASYKPEVDKRRKSYLPYRQDLIGVFAGMSRFRH